MFIMLVFRLVVTSSDSCFHNRVNGVKNSKSICDLSVRENVTTGFGSNITSEPIKSILSRKSVLDSLYTKRLSRASVSTLSVESNVSFSDSRTNACLDQCSSLFNIQEYCNLFFSGSFNIRIPLQNVLTEKILFYIFTFLFNAFCVLYYKFSVIKMNVFINLFLAIGLTKLTCLRKFLTLHISKKGTFLHSIVKTCIIF